MSEMVKRVAQALARSNIPTQDPQVEVSFGERDWRRFVAPARNAIAAMREPTKTMASEGVSYTAQWPGERFDLTEYFISGWRAAISEALK